MNGRRTLSRLTLSWVLKTSLLLMGWWWWDVPPCLSSSGSWWTDVPSFNVFLYITFFCFWLFVSFLRNPFLPLKAGRQAPILCARMRIVWPANLSWPNWVLCVMWPEIEFCFSFDVFLSVPQPRRLLASAESGVSGSTYSHQSPPVLRPLDFHSSFRVSLTSFSWTWGFSLGFHGTCESL